MAQQGGDGLQGHAAVDGLGYEVFARWPQVSGAAADAAYTIAHDNGNTSVGVDQSQVAGDTGETDTEAKDVTYSYDVNGNQVQVQDNSSGATVDTYMLTNDGLNRVAQVQESLAGSVRNTTSYTTTRTGTR